MLRFRDQLAFVYPALPFIFLMEGGRGSCGFPCLYALMLFQLTTK